MNRLRPYFGTLSALLILLILPLLLYGNVTLGGLTMLPVDNLYQWAPWTAVADQFGVTQPQNGLISDLIIQNYAWKQFVRDTIIQGDIPLWNPYLFAGVPFLAAGQHFAYYPFSLLFLIVPLPFAYGWYTLTQLWLAGVLMFVYGRILGLNRGSALIGGIIYQGCGTLVVSSAVFPMVVGAMVWLPLLLGCIEKICQAWGPAPAKETRFPLLWVLGGGVALACQLLAGHIEYSIYTLLVMALYGAWRLASRWWQQRDWADAGRRFGLLWGMVLLGLLLGGIQLIPLYELGQVNFREADSTLEEIRGYGFPERRILTLALPNFFGNPAHHSYRDALSGEVVPFEVNYDGQTKRDSMYGDKNYVEGGIYLGILPLILAGLGLFGFWRNGRIWFYTLLALASLAFIFGTPLYALLFYGLPFVNQLHTPFRWVFPFSFCVAALAMYGVETVLRRDWKRPFTLLATLVSLSGLGLLTAVWLSRVFIERLEPTLNQFFLGLAQATSAFPSGRAFYSYQFWQLLTLGFVLLGCGAVLWLGRRLDKRPFIALAAALIIVDLFLPNRGFHAAVDPALLTYQPALVQWLEEQERPFRITTYTPRGDTPFNANSSWLFFLEDIRGYDSIIPKQYTEYMGAIEPQGGLLFNRIQPIKTVDGLNSPLLDVLNVKFVISSDIIELPKYEPVWEGEGLRVYENLGVAPRAYTLPQTATAVVADPLTALRTQFDPRQTVVVEPAAGIGPEEAPQPASYAPASITHQSNRRVLLETAVSEPSWLILNDSYFPGWNAYARPADDPAAEEVQLPVTQVNGNFRGVQLEPGAWTVRFQYSPPSFWLGAISSLMGVVILLFGTAVWGWQRAIRPASEPSDSVVRSLAKNSVAPMLLNLFNKFIDFAFALYYLRVLGPVDAGSYQTAITTALLFEIISNFGLDILLIRDVSQDRSKLSHYLFNTTVLRLGAGVVASLPVILFLTAGNTLTGAEVVATLLIMLGMVFSGMSKGVTGLFYIHEQAETPATMTTATTIMKVGLGVVALLLGTSFVGLAAVSIIVNIITLAILGGIALRRYEIQGPWQLDLSLQRAMLVKGWPLMLIHLLQTVFISVDILLLRLMLPNGQEVVGYYSSAYKWFNALQVIPSFFTLALFPIITRRIGESIEAARRMYTLSLKLMLLLALPIAAVTVFLAEPLVQLLAGAEFLPQGAIALSLVILSIPFGWLNSVTNYVLIGLGLEQRQPRAFAVAVLFNIVANLIFIPRFTYIAASITTILSEVVLMVLFAYFMRERMPGMKWGQLMKRPFLLAGVMLGGLYLGGLVHPLLGLLLGMGIYLGGLLGLGILGNAEREVLRNLLPAPIASRLRI